MDETKSDKVKRLIAENAAQIRLLHRSIHDTFSERTKSSAHWKAWESACVALHHRYDSLAFPGGYGRALAALAINDPGTVETALCFVELRPYFFRSGYMYTVLMRRLKKCALTPEQAERYAQVAARAAEWRRLKQEKQKQQSR